MISRKTNYKYLEKETTYFSYSRQNWLIKKLEFEIQRWAALMDATCCSEWVGYSCSKHYMYIGYLSYNRSRVRGEFSNGYTRLIYCLSNLMTLIFTDILLNSTLGIIQRVVERGTVTELCLTFRCRWTVNFSRLRYIVGITWNELCAPHRSSMKLWHWYI